MVIVGVNKILVSKHCSFTSIYHLNHRRDAGIAQGDVKCVEKCKTDGGESKFLVVY